MTINRFHVVFVLMVAAVIIANEVRDVLADPRKQHESVYARALCDELHGESEARLADATRVDCLTDELAIEVDFADKWPEAVGQSVHYARSTERRPGIALIVEDPGMCRHVERARRALARILVMITGRGLVTIELSLIGEQCPGVSP